MSSHGLTKENLAAMFPVALQKDPSMAALAEVIAAMLSERLGEIDKLRIYSQLDRLDDKLLDILAYDFKVDWWDPDYGLEEKRRTLKSSWSVHKTLGTKAATERAIAAVYPDSSISEWFDYGGEPHHFRVNIRNEGSLGSQRGLDRFYRLVAITKRLSSWLDEIITTTDMGERRVRLGGRGAMISRMPVPQMADDFTMDGALRIGGVSAAMHSFPIPEIPS